MRYSVISLIAAIITISGLHAQTISESLPSEYIKMTGKDTTFLNILKVDKKELTIWSNKFDKKLKIKLKDIESYHFNDLGLIPYNRSESGEIEYSGVIAVPDVNKNELFSRAREWFADTYKSSKDVLELDDREGGLLVGTGWTSFYPAPLGIATELKLYSTVKVQVKDGRFKYTIDNFEVYSSPSQYSSGGRSALDSGQYGVDNPNPKWIRNAKAQILNDIDRTIKNLIKAMSIETAADDW